ncbi:unnamed protein product, partial [Closterium sp. NIES-64]
APLHFPAPHHNHILVSHFLSTPRVSLILTCPVLPHSPTAASVQRDDRAVLLMTASVQRDDGAVLLMNGAEFFRSNMPAGPITSASFAATGTWGADKTTFFNSTPFRSIAQFLQPGTKWVGVQLHQSQQPKHLTFANARMHIPCTLSLTYFTSPHRPGTNWPGTNWVGVQLHQSRWSSDALTMPCAPAPSPHAPHPLFLLCLPSQPGTNWVGVQLHQSRWSSDALTMPCTPAPSPHAPHPLFLLCLPSQPGTNWVGVQLHQSRWSSDALFDLELTRHAMRPCSALEGSPAACVRTPPADTLLLAQGSTWAYNDASLPPPNPDTWPRVPSSGQQGGHQPHSQQHHQPRAPSSGQQQGGHQPHSQQHHQRLTSPAPLAAGNNRAGTNLTLNSTTSGSRVAHYFRRAFTVTDAACHVALTVSFNIADGALSCPSPLPFHLPAHTTPVLLSTRAHISAHISAPAHILPHLSTRDTLPLCSPCPYISPLFPPSYPYPPFPPLPTSPSRVAYRFQMPPPSWGPVTPATNATGGYVWRWVPSVLSGGWLQQGANVIAVEVHQQRSTNTLLTFDVQVTSKREAIACTPAPQ